MTTKDIISHDWQVLRKQVQDRWYSLTDEDVRKVNGNYEMLLSVLQKRYFYSRATAADDANNFLNQFEMTKRQHVHA